MQRFVLAASVLLLSLGPVYAEERPELPKEIRDANEVLAKWIDGFNGKTLAQLRKTLGTPTQESTWEFKGEKLPLLEYQCMPKSKLSFYFYDGRVIKVSLLMMSK